MNYLTATSNTPSKLIKRNSKDCDIDMIFEVNHDNMLNYDLEKEPFGIKSEMNEENLKRKTGIQYCNDFYKIFYQNIDDFSY